MKTSAIKQHEVSFESNQRKLVKASKQFREYYFAKPEHYDEFNSLKKALHYPEPKDDLSKYVKASEVLSGLQEKIIALLPNPKAAGKVKVHLDQVSDTTFIKVRKSGFFGWLGLGKKAESSLLKKGEDGKTVLIPLTQDSLASKLADEISTFTKK